MQGKTICVKHTYKRPSEIQMILCISHIKTVSKPRKSVSNTFEHRFFFCLTFVFFLNCTIYLLTLRNVINYFWAMFQHCYCVFNWYISKILLRTLIFRSSPLN